VNVKIPATVGVPESTPEESSVSPFGTDPLDTENVYGAMPPIAVIVCEYRMPVVPEGGEGGASVMEAQPIEIVYPWLAVQPYASVTLTVNEKLPFVVGVPEIRPEEERVKPFGNMPEPIANV
jgi:hypothetical protein